MSFELKIFTKAQYSTPILLLFCTNHSPHILSSLNDTAEEIELSDNTKCPDRGWSRLSSSRIIVSCICGIDEKVYSD